jgi:hypothetical protein
MVIASHGDWVVVTDLNSIHGKTTKEKSTAVHSAATARHIRVATCHQHDFMYVKLINSAVA